MEAVERLEAAERAREGQRDPVPLACSESPSAGHWQALNLNEALDDMDAAAAVGDTAAMMAAALRIRRGKATPAHPRLSHTCE